MGLRSTKLAVALAAAMSVGSPAAAAGWSDLVATDPQIQPLFDAAEAALEAAVTDGRITRGASGTLASLLYASDTLVCSAWQISVRQLEQEIIVDAGIAEPPYELLRAVTALKDRIVAACDRILQGGFAVAENALPVTEEDIGVPALDVAEDTLRYLDGWGFVDDLAYQTCYREWLAWQGVTASIERNHRGKRAAEIRSLALERDVIPAIERDLRELRFELQLVEARLPGRERDVAIARLDLRIDQFEADLAGFRQYLADLTDRLPGLTQELADARAALPPAAAALQECMSVFDLSSGAPVVATFRTDASGWKVVGDAGPEPAFAPGELSATDRRSGEVWYWDAPLLFRGDHALLYGSELVYNLRVTAITQSFESPDVILEGAGLTLHLDAGADPSENWTEFRHVLDPSAGWTVAGEDRPATAEEIQQVLADITALRIRGEFNDGPDTGWLGTVVLGARN